MSANVADQNSGLRRIILVLLAIGLVSILSLMVAGATSLISLADRIHPVAGTVVFWAICLAAGFSALYCVIAYAQLPPALVPPEETSGPKHEAYLQSLRLRLGNNPLVIALPFNKEAIVLDMAMSQLSYGALEKAAAAKERLPVHAGYNNNGELTKDAAAILESKRMLPIGYWKGAGLSLLLDLLATILSAGQSVHEISRHEVEHGLSQVFIAIDINKLDRSAIKLAVDRIIEDYHQSIPVDESKQVLYPGERVLATRKRNLSDGIPVDKVVWNKIKSL